MKREFKYAYVQITADGIIQNIAMFDNYEDANYITRCTYGDDAFALAYNYAVGIGDIYKNECFYIVEEDGSLVVAEYIPNDEENIQILKAENKELTTQLTDTQLALTEQYEENLALQEEVTNTQIALTELYEASL